MIFLLVVHLTWQYLKLDLQLTPRYLELFRSKLDYNELKKTTTEK